VYFAYADDLRLVWSVGRDLSQDGSNVFLAAEVLLIGWLAVILIRGLMNIKTDVARAKRQIAFSLPSLTLIVLSYAWPLIRGISK
jgi:hypothetical protein